ncbi:acyltransferase [Pseudomonas sp. 17391]|uniref:acyltransferase family protein n=1 Tax=Pseudomonas sp. 17391 TaxID=2967217 RepID=UPI002364A4C8|nr:acyltransferase family protein [Pseudomonas sp. 17391]MDD2129119.1 acyltransferase [Pseudomonas sp. 17391]
MHVKKMSYRPDIDGLRALAVLAVVIFHFNKQWLPGGFVGVDIFFVISGYLITGIISKEVSKGEFSFVDFYMRRVRRILPAAFFLIFTTTLFGIAFMVPMDARDLSSSAIASIFSVANIYFWKYLDVGYFAASSDLVPLLHMWSLGVEEQFYLLWPALLIVLYKAGGRKAIVFTAVLIAAVSFLYGESKLISDPRFAYYMLPSRAGELLIGALAYFASETWKDRISQAAAQALAVIGIVAVGVSIAFISETGGFPGLISLLPAVGVAVVIFAGAMGKNIVSSLLSCRPFVLVGLVSFSLYLWHWPILAFYRYAYGQPTGAGYLICGALLVLATLVSYYLVEVPFRRPAARVLNFKGVAVAALAILTVSGSYYTIGVKGLVKELSPQGYHAKVTEHFNQTKAAYRYDYNCQMASYDPKLMDLKRCVIGPDAKPSVLIFGDSNSAHYVGYWKVVAEDRKISMRNISHNSCVPFAGDKSRPYVKEASRNSCQMFNAEVRRHFDSFDTIIVSADWEGYKYRTKNYVADIDDLVKELSATGKNIIIGLKVPIFKDYDRSCDLKSLKIPGLDCASRGVYPDDGETEINNQIIAIAGKYNNVKTFTLRNYVCTNGTCSSYLDGKPIYFDLGHLSMAGSEQIGRLSVAEHDMPGLISQK